MKQKYEIVVNKDENKVVIREFAQLDKEIMSLLCQETFALDAVETALAAGSNEQLFAALRSNNMYPPAIYVQNIADKVSAMLTENVAGPEEVVLDDLEFLSTYISTDLSADIVDLGKEDESLDALLDPAGFEELEMADKDELEKIGDTLKVDDSEFSDMNADV